jgi:hypothetical protein
LRFLGGLGGKRLVLVSMAIFGAAGGIAFASIPDSGTGTYHACMLVKDGTIRIIDPATDQCKAKTETEITFNKQGPQGPSPTVTQLPTGNTNCPNGGAAITDSANSTAYVCSGQPFSGTFTSPNGQYSIAVTDSGVTITGAGNTVSVAGTGVRVDTHGTSPVTVMSSGDLTLRSGANASLESSSNLTVRAGSVGTVESSSALNVKGSTVNVNGGGACPGAARKGDAVDTSTILGGSSTVCIGG